MPIKKQPARQNKRKTSRKQPSDGLWLQGSLYTFFCDSKGSLNIKRLLVSLVVGIFALSVPLAKPIQQHYGDYVTQFMQSSTQLFMRSVGLAINDVHIKGVKYVKKNSIYKALQLPKSNRITDYDLEKAYARLMRISGIRHAEIRWVFPGQLIVSIEEAKPLAIYRDEKGNDFVLANNGEILYDMVAQHNRHLLLVEGDEVMQHAPEFIQKIRRIPYIYAHAQKIMFVGKRRWDLTLDNGVVIKLPEHNYGNALDILHKLDKDKKILNHRIARVDMRIDGRVTIKPRERFLLHDTF